ncbi:TetR/AcrR family transcriptional regulator [Paenibacillus hodogayensis]|uniref:TetR/AcrR family transcriptional regulator n=1 Tax=Paenibacillus hodogayensis TaxID=279208 RepID=A0ABV5VR54_9BACL
MKQPNDEQDTLPDTKESAAPGSRREERDTEYRRRILATASDLIERRGTECVTMYQIAQEAGVGQGTLYRRYAHLGEVCSDLMQTTVDTFLQSLGESVAEADPSTPAMRQLSDIISLSIDFIDQKASLLHTIHSMYVEKKSHTIYQKPFFRTMHDLLQPLLARAVEQGEIRDIDIPLTVNTLLVAVSPNQYLYHRDVLGYDKKRFMEGICRIFVKGL